jgi:hypothetical protein
MLKFLPSWNEVLFPGFVVLLFGVGGAVCGWFGERRTREYAALYGSITVLALWESFGPAAGLYRLTYHLLPGFDYLRAPSRFGLLTGLALCILAALGVTRLLAAMSKTTLAALPVITLAAAEILVPLPFAPPPPANPAYTQLAAMPYGSLLELPVYSQPLAYMRAGYMLGSTTHWMPLVDAYSDYIPDDFAESRDVLGEFPTRESLDWLASRHVRYALVHVDAYTEPAMRARLFDRLREFEPRLRTAYEDDATRLYEIVEAAPPPPAASVAAR